MSAAAASLAPELVFLGVNVLIVLIAVVALALFVLRRK